VTFNVKTPAAVQVLASQAAIPMCAMMMLMAVLQMMVMMF
jgi:hypothetical protein